jgi:EmrB/QacA subfamily drug resistance transporter
MVGIPAEPGTSTQQVRWGLPLTVLIAGMFMSILDVSIVNVAIPTIQKDFGATTDDVQWVATAYTLALGVVVPLSGWLGDRFGLGRIYTLSVLGFAAGSALCGVAWSLDSLIAFRIIQAIPGGIVPVVTMSMVYLIVPREKIGTAMGLYGLGVVFAPAVGPTLGGYLVEYVDWRLIFFINVPIGVLGALAAVLVLPQLTDGRAGRLDFWGFLTISSGLFALLLALSEGQDWGWTSYRVLMLLTYSGLSLALFVVIELEVDQPLLDVRMFRYGQFTNSLVLIGLMSVALFAVLFYIPLLLQQGQNLGAFETGLVLFPQALVMGVLMPIAGRLYDLIGPRWPAVIGLAIVAVGTYLLHDLTLDSSREHIMWLLMFRAVGMGLAMMPIMTGGMAAVPNQLVSRASAFNNVVQRCVAALGLAILTAVLTEKRAQQMADRSALVPDTTPAPSIGVPGAPPTAGLYGMYQQTQLRVFVAATDDLFLITAGIGVVGVFGALFLRSDLAKKLAALGSAPVARDRPGEPQPAGSAPGGLGGPVSGQTPAASPRGAPAS